MGYMIVDISQTSQEDATPIGPASIGGGWHKGVLTVRAKASGSGTWSATFNVAPIDVAGLVGEALQIVCTNAAPQTEDTVQSGSHAFIGWWSDITGTVTAGTGTAEG